MRLRRRPELHEAIKGYQDIVFLNEKVEDNLRDRENIMLEIGTGKGSFIAGLALSEKKSFYVGIESQVEVIYYAARKIREAQLGNVRLLHGNAGNIANWFEPGQVDTVYINFCDPWPKARHTKRRLVARNFLEKYRNIIRPGGELKLKTDNKSLFAFALEEFAASGLIIHEQSVDLHKSDLHNPVWTEYELKFHKLGMPVCYARVSF